MLTSLSTLKKSFTDPDFEWWAMYKSVLEKRCKIYTDLNRFREESANIPYLNKLLKNSTTGGSEIFEYEKSKGKLLHNQVLLSFNENCEFENKNRLTLNKKDSKDLEEICRNESIRVSTKNDNNFSNWTAISTKLPITGIIIADPFLLEDDEIKNNLLKLIEAILPEKAERVDISLFAKDKQGLAFYKRKLNDLELQIKQKYEVKYSLHLIHIKSKNIIFHDRNILTNYVRFNSGDSFNYYQDSKFSNEPTLNKETTLNITGLAGAEKNPHFSMIKYFKDIAKKGTKGLDMIGDGENNLYSLV